MTEQKIYRQRHFNRIGISIGISISVAFGLILGKIALDPTIGLPFGIQTGMAM